MTVPLTNGKWQSMWAERPRATAACLSMSPPPRLLHMTEAPCDEGVMIDWRRFRRGGRDGWLGRWRRRGRSKAATPASAAAATHHAHHASSSRALSWRTASRACGEGGGCWLAGATSLRKVASNNQRRCQHRTAQGVGGAPLMQHGTHRLSEWQERSRLA